MLGSERDKQFKCKAAERFLFGGGAVFWVSALRRHAAKLGADADVLIEAGEKLVGYMDIVRASETSMSDAAIRRMMDAYKRHMVLMSRFDCFTPKHHLMMHLTFRARVFGNPRCYATWEDESFNKRLKALVQGCHQSNFEIRAFATFAAFYAREVKRQRRA